MGIFEMLFGKKTKNHIVNEESLQINEELNINVEKIKSLFSNCLNIYNLNFCQCAYPRFQQIVGIDCRNYGDSFKSYDTEILINISKIYFDFEKSILKDECSNEIWVCKKCKSIYEYGWSDFSIHIDRQKLKLITLNTPLNGKQSIKPIPLYLGLIGHSYPSTNEINTVTYDEFERYMTEK